MISQNYSREQHLLMKSLEGNLETKVKARGGEESNLVDLDIASAKGILSKLGRRLLGFLCPECHSDSSLSNLLEWTLVIVSSC